MDLIASCK
ncbi:hypothetical protein CISIN_1g0073662mg, partial [Citrus sinensis]